MSDFKKEDLTNLQVNDTRVQPLPFAGYTTGLSTFPIAIDKLKTISYSATSINSINAELERYYELLLLYLNKDASFNAKIPEFKSLSETISAYSLTSKDYIYMRDGIIEVATYLRDLSSKEIYGEDGIYTRLTGSAEDFQNSLNAIIEDINNHYSQLPDDELGKIVPDGSVNKNHLDEEVLNTFNYIENTNGIYVDRSMEEDIVLPSGLSKLPVVIKVVE